MDITTNQAIQNLILVYLEDHPSFLETIKQKFASVFDTSQMPMVDEDTERRIGVALAEHKAGKGTVITSPKELTDFLDSVKEERPTNWNSSLAFRKRTSNSSRKTQP